MEAAKMEGPYTWDPDAVRRAVEADPAAVHRRDEFGCTPLANAAAAGDDDLVAFLLEQGADPNGGAEGDPPLHWAVNSEVEGSTAVVVRLLAAGADVHEVGSNGWAPLHVAACRGRVEKCRLLLDAGAEVDRRATIDDYRTPLMEAAAAGHPEVVRLLLDRGGDASLRDETSGKTARSLAVEAGRGHDPKIYRFLKGLPRVDPAETLADVDFPDEASRDMTFAILADHDLAESYRERADRMAAEGRHAEVVRILDEHAPRRGWRGWFRFLG
jgi:hypothetical protein